MIASVRGPVLHIGSGHLIIEVGGLGLRVEVPSGSRAPRVSVGETITMFTSLIVREDALTLVGFATREEIEVFGHLTGVSGVGPRSALGVLSALSPADIVQAVRTENDKAFRAAPGIGPKTSKLLVLQLAGKLDDISLEHDVADRAPSEDPQSRAASTVTEGLVSLGWSETQAEQAVGDALTAGAEDTPEALLRSALALLQSTQMRGGAS